MARVVIEHLTKVFDGPKGQSIRALEEINLTVEDKELMVLVGPSGCGKTTLLRLISGLDDVTKGEISIGGTPMKNVPPGEREIAMVFQNHALYPHMSAYENMAFGLRVRKFARREIESRVNETAEMLNLVNCLERNPKELSGGQRQRVALGRAIVRRPEVFLFDEPLSNLDAQMRVQMRTEIAKMHKRLGATMLYVTHDQVEAMTMGNRIAVMNRGVIEQVGEPLSVYERPANLYVAGFIGSPRMNLFEAMVTQKNGSLYVEEPSAGNSELIEPRISVRLKDETASLLNSYKGKKIVFGVRPEKIRSAQNMMEAKGLKIEAVVEMVERAGAETFVYLTRGRQPLVLRAAEGEYVRENERRALCFDMAEARFFDATTGRAIVR